MLSRVADSLYWMSRYIERAEDITRILTVNYHALLDLPIDDEARAWEPLIKITGDTKLFEKAFGSPKDFPDGESPYTARNVSEFLLWHPANPHAALPCVNHARENARSVREQISSEMWEAINRLYFLTKEVNKAAVLRGPAEFFAQLRDGSHIFQGITHATMTHNDAYEFIQLGKHIERADKTSRTVDVKYASLDGLEDGSPQAALHLLAMLRSCSAMEAYRKEYQQVQTWRVAEFLLLSRAFPRSVRFCLNQCRQAANVISGGPSSNEMSTNSMNSNGMNMNMNMRTKAPEQTPPQRIFGRLVSEMEYVDIRDVLGEGMHPYLDQLQQRINRAGDEITLTFFSTQIILPGANSNQQAQQQQQQ